jgi:YHS domain-containing protein
MMADLIMIRKELVTGYVVAGFLAVIVPASVWNVLFFHGHGVWTSLENVVVGPLIAVVSFVCSIGNVPLAAALWTGGISFGGVVSFIFGDLITMPLLLIYRKYYGWALTWRLALGLWAVMSAAGLITELLFGAAGGIPSVRPIQAIVVGFQWNYTTFLNFVAIAGFAFLYWLYRNRDRLGEYATDPVCGMQVERATATATMEHNGQKFYFCSEQCHDRFAKDPDRYLEGAAQPEPMAPTAHEGHDHKHS